MQRWWAVIACGCALAQAACGGDEERAATVIDDAATATTQAPTTAPATTATEPARTMTATTAPSGETTTPAATTPTEPTGGAGAPDEEKAAPGGAGDEEGVRSPAAFTVDGDAVTPESVAVPAFLGIELRIVGDARAHEVVLETPDPVRLSVPAGQTVTRRVPGVRAGSYSLRVDGAVRGRLVVG